MGTNIKAMLDRMSFLDPHDLELLLTTEGDHLIGRIMELNHARRYHNGLDAIVLYFQIVELRDRLNDLPDNTLIDL